MAKVIGKITEDELARLQKTKDNISKYKDEQEKIQELMELKLENVNLKINLENMLKDYVLREINLRYPDKNFAKVFVNENGEIIDASEEDAEKKGEVENEVNK